MFLYVNRVHEPKKNRLTFPELLNSIRWINVIGLINHLVFGFYKKYSYEQIVQPLWTQSKNIMLITISIYLVAILITSLLIYLYRKYEE